MSCKEAQEGGKKKREQATSNKQQATTSIWFWGCFFFLKPHMSLPLWERTQFLC
jgi:hypothetical protein